MSSGHDVTFFAETNYCNERRKFGIRRRDRSAHMYMVGRTGTGKSTLLETLIAADIAAGNGVDLLDPHGDLAQRAEAHAAERREHLIRI